MNDNTISKRKWKTAITKSQTSAGDSNITIGYQQVETLEQMERTIVERFISFPKNDLNFQSGTLHLELKQ